MIPCRYSISSSVPDSSPRSLKTPPHRGIPFHLKNAPHLRQLSRRANLVIPAPYDHSNPSNEVTYDKAKALVRIEKYSLFRFSIAPLATRATQRRTHSHLEGRLSFAVSRPRFEFLSRFPIPAHRWRPTFDSDRPDPWRSSHCTDRPRPSDVLPGSRPPTPGKTSIRLHPS